MLMNCFSIARMFERTIHELNRRSIDSFHSRRRRLSGHSVGQFNTSLPLPSLLLPPPHLHPPPSTHPHHPHWIRSQCCLPALTSSLSYGFANCSLYSDEEWLAYARQLKTSAKSPSAEIRTFLDLTVETIAAS